MGKCAGLFFNTETPEECLNWRVGPSEKQFAAQQARWNDLADYLLSQLKEKSGKTSRSWLQGSYKFGTQVRPAQHDQEFDIDLGVYLEWPGDAEDGNLSPKQLKNLVQTALKTYAAQDDNESTSVSAPKDRCNRIHFDDSFHIDVPSYHLEPTTDERSLATEADRWEESDPKAIHRWWIDSLGEQLLPRARRLVRYAKMWAALAFNNRDRPSSIMLTVLVGEALPLLNANELSGDDEYFSAIVDAILSRLEADASVPNPANVVEDLNRLDPASEEVLIEKLRGLSKKCSKALQASTRTEAAEIWSDVFVHFFPLPPQEELREALSKSAALVPIQFDPEVEIIATPEGRGQAVLRGKNSIGPIPKESTITFRIINSADLPKGAVVHWTVRNVGEEAEDSNDLGHSNEPGILIEEHAAYKGEHFMDVRVALAGNVIGRRRILIRIHGLAMPPRNPPRPGYVKHRK